MTDDSLEISRSVVLLVCVDGVEEVNSELPVEDKPGAVFFLIEEN
jgi:hypothetical protein